MLDESVRLRLMSDVPLGAMLSGGLDSSLIVALMARHMREPVKTFCVGFTEAGEGNELADARLVADHFGTDHHELELSLTTNNSTSTSRLAPRRTPRRPLRPRFLRSRDSPPQHVTVALSGQGADELLGGYQAPRAACSSIGGGSRDRVPPASPSPATGRRRSQRHGRIAGATRRRPAPSLDDKLDSGRAARQSACARRRKRCRSALA